MPLNSRAHRARTPRDVTEFPVAFLAPSAARIPAGRHTLYLYARSSVPTLSRTCPACSKHHVKKEKYEKKSTLTFSQ